MNLLELVEYLDAQLKIAELPDYPSALNGLQVENSGRVTRIAAAVDATQASIDAAVRADCDLLLVHHGLFWDGPGRIVGRRYRRLQALLANDVAVYSAHLPLDLHPEWGNNVQLARALGLSIRGLFGKYQDTPIGVWGDINIHREALTARLDDLLGVRVKLVAGGPETIVRAGVITGGAAEMINEAANMQLDAFITGEGAHYTYFDAMENGINVFYAGHYATETFGVRALAAHVDEKFGLPWTFIDQPTGL